MLIMTPNAQLTISPFVLVTLPQAWPYRPVIRDGRYIAYPVLVYLVTFDIEDESPPPVNTTALSSSIAQ